MRLQAVRQNVGFGVNQRVNQRQLEAALRGYRLGYRATGYRRQNVGFAVTAGVTAAVTSVGKTPAGLLTDVFTHSC